MIKSFRVQNFKILRDIRIEPERVNVLIGPNGCGKSSVLQALDFMKAFFMSSIEVYLQSRGWNYKDIPNVKGSSRTIQWELVAELDADASGRAAGKYAYSVSLSPRRYLAIGKEQLDYTPPNGNPITLLKRVGRKAVVFERLRDKEEQNRYVLAGLPASALFAFTYGSERDTNIEMRRFTTRVRRFRYFLNWNPEALRSPDRGRHVLVGPSGEHLAPVLANLKQRKPAEFQSLLARLRRFFPELQDISFSGKGWGWRSIRLHQKTRGREVVLNNRQVSDGLLRLLAISSFLYLDNIPTVLMFEEPENGVHPHILREIVQILRELTLRKPPNRCQILFTTHSPYVLDEFYEHPEQVWVMDFMDGMSATQIAKLTEKTQIEKAKKHFGSLGEAWFANVVGGNPPMLPFTQ